MRNLWQFAFMLMLGSTTLLGSSPKQEIRVGIILPLSGNLSAYGKATLDGIKLRVDDLNNQASSPIAIKLFVEDNKGDKTESKNAFKKLVAADQVITVIGPITSNNTKAVRRDALKLKVPVISPTATNDLVTLKNSYVFRTCFNDSFQGQIVANYALKTGIHKASSMIDMNSDYSKGLAASFEQAFTAGGGKIVSKEHYQQKDSEFGTQLKKIKATGAELIFVPGYPPEVQLIIKQAKVMGLTARLAGADGWDNDAVINGSGENIKGCFIVGAFSREDKRPAVQNFISQFKKSVGKEPGTFEALGYDSVSLFIQAITGQKATAKNVKDGLLRIKNFEAVTGKITITKDGDALKSAVVLGIVKEGATFTTKYLSTVNP